MDTKSKYIKIRKNKNRYIYILMNFIKRKSNEHLNN